MDAAFDVDGLADHAAGGIHAQKGGELRDLVERHARGDTGIERLGRRTNGDRHDGIAILRHQARQTLAFAAHNDEHGLLGEREVGQRHVAGAVEAQTPKGMRIQSPTYQALNREREKLRSWLAEFGLTPAQRARVTTAIRAQLTLFEGGAGKGDAPVANAGDATSFADF